MISLLRRFLGILSLRRGTGFSGAHGWVQPGSTITDSVEFSFRLDTGVVLPGDLHLERLFADFSAAAVSSAGQPPEATAAETAIAASTPPGTPSTGTVVEPVAPVQEERKTTRAA